VPDISWLYVPDPVVGKTNRISFPSHYSRNVAPAGCSAILAEITHQPGDEVASMSDAELVQEVTDTLRKMQILKQDQIIYTSVERQPFAYVVYDLDYQKNIALIRKYCGDLGIPLVGRFAQFEYLNMDGCIRNVMDFVASGP
jgi:protoporphyrinogen oxidase